MDLELYSGDITGGGNILQEDNVRRLELRREHLRQQSMPAPQSFEQHLSALVLQWVCLVFLEKALRNIPSNSRQVAGFFEK